MARLASIFSGRSPQYLLQLSWKTINSRNPQHDERKTASVYQFLHTVWISCLYDHVMFCTVKRTNFVDPSCIYCWQTCMSQSSRIDVNQSINHGFNEIWQNAYYDKVCANKSPNKSPLRQKLKWMDGQIWTSKAHSLLICNCNCNWLSRNICGKPLIIIQ